MINQKFTKIGNLIKIEKLRSDKRVMIFLICLAISTGLWFLNALSKDYTTSVFYPVKYVNIPEKQFLVNSPPTRFELKVNAHGFTLLRHKLNLAFTPIVLNVSKITANKNNQINETDYRIATSSLTNTISSQISNEISIIDILPATLQISLDRLFTKEVPVKTFLLLDFKPQHNLSSEIITTPAFVTIEGPKTLIDTIEYILLEKEEFKNLRKTTSKDIDVIKPEKISVSPKKVKVTIDVEEFTENQLLLPIEVEGKPKNVKIKLFPSDIKASFRVGLSQFSEVKASNFKVVVPYSEIESGASLLHVTIKSQPHYIYDIKYTPQSIEYLIETN